VRLSFLGECGNSLALNLCTRLQSPKAYDHPLAFLEAETWAVYKMVCDFFYLQETAKRGRVTDHGFKALSLVRSNIASGLDEPRRGAIMFKPLHRNDPSLQLRTSGKIQKMLKCSSHFPDTEIIHVSW